MAAPAARAADLSEAQLEKVRNSKAKAIEARKARKAAEAAKKAEDDTKKAQRIMKIPGNKRTMAQKNFAFKCLGDEALELPPSDVEGNSSEEDRRERVKTYRAKQARVPTPTTNSSGVSSSSAPAPPAVPAAPTQPSSSAAGATTCKAPVQPRPPRLNTRAALPATAAPAGLFGFVAKALGVSPELNLPAARAPSGNKPAQNSVVEVESDSSEESPRGPGCVPEEWARSFEAHQLQQSSGPVAAEPLAAAEPEPAPVVSSNVSTLALRDLVDLVEVGEPVCWPPGLNVQVARHELSNRSAAHAGTAEALRPRVEAKPKAQATTAAERLAALRARRNLPTAPGLDQPPPGAATANAKSKTRRSA